MTIQHYYPVRGHSYMPPDRVFGRIEQTLRKHETVMLPEEYNALIADYAQVRVLGIDWHLHDYKSAAAKICKKKMDFPMTKTRVYRIDSKSIGVKGTFSGDFCSHTVIKRGSKIQALKVSQLPLQSNVKTPKAKDVKMLLEKLGVDINTSPKLKCFYSTVMQAASHVDKHCKNGSDVEECDFDEDEMDY